MDSTIVSALSDSATAQAVQNLLTQAGTTPAQWLHFVAALAVGALFAPLAKNFLAHVVQSSPNILVRFGAPMITGMIGSTIAAFAFKTWGVTPQDAAQAFAAFIGVYEAMAAGGIGKTLGAIERLVLADAPTVLKIAGAAAAAAGQPEILAGVAIAGKALSAVEAIHASAQASVAPDPTQAAPSMPPLQTMKYADGSSAAGSAPLPLISPEGSPAVVAPTQVRP